MNVITILGNVTQEPKKFKNMVSLSVADSHRIGKGDGAKEVSTFFNCIFFGENLDWIIDRFHKGDRVMVSGELYMEEYKGNKNIKVITTRIQMVRQKNPQPEQQEPREQQGNDVREDDPGTYPQDDINLNPVTGDDLPF